MIRYSIGIIRLFLKFSQCKILKRLYTFLMINTVILILEIIFNTLIYKIYYNGQNYLNKHD